MIKLKEQKAESCYSMSENSLHDTVYGRPASGQMPGSKVFLVSIIVFSGIAILSTLVFAAYLKYTGEVFWMVPLQPLAMGLVSGLISIIVGMSDSWRELGENVLGGFWMFFIISLVAGVITLLTT